MVYVTHDQVEAMTLADKIVVMQSGVIEQVGSPIGLYSNPVNRFVAGFIGSPKMNFLAASGDGAGLALPGGRLNVARAPNSVTEIGVRPEHLRLDEGGDGAVRGIVAATEHLGSDTLVHIDVPGAARPLLVRLSGEAPVRHGSSVTASFDREFAYAFDGAGNRVDLSVALAKVA